jgi:eukaryotic-like serine/threonine-protein kinase
MLARGARVGTYEVLELIGAGGMGEVFRARDSRLGRDVALKVLSESFKLDTQRRARLEREARVLASLNHPNIATLHGLEDVEDTQALVLELVEGQTLRERIAEGAIPWAEALAISQQMAAALEAAHEHGVVHRDLKPDNIKLRPDGTVKLLDFGVAKVFSPESERGAPEAVTVTALGIDGSRTVMGTPAYMSPEQARGLPVDKRADIWAFGCVLYEMLTGQRIFAAARVSDVVAKIIEREADFAPLPSDTPAPIRRLLRRCLAKDPRQRLRDIGDARVEIAEALTATGSDEAPRVSARSRKTTWALLSVLGLAAVLGAGLLISNAMRSPDARPVTRFSMIIPRAQVPEGGAYQFLALSPQGTHVAYIANNRIFLRAMDEFEARPVAGTDDQGSLVGVLFSPDGQSIVFHSLRYRELRKVPLAGGTPVRLAAATDWFGGSWGEDDEIVFAQTDGIYIAPGAGGTARRVIAVNREQGELAMNPQRLPGNRGVLFTLARSAAGSAATKSIVVQRPGASGRRVVIERGADARYLKSSHLLYTDQRTLLVVRFDLDSLATHGAPMAVATPITTAAITDASAFAVSPDGSLIYHTPPPEGSAYAPTRTLSWVDRQGNREAVNAPPRAYNYVRVSPDGTRIAASVRDEGEEIYVWEVKSRTFTRLTFSPDLDQLPVWTPDSTRVVFMSRSGGKTTLTRKAVDGTGAMEPMFSSAETLQPSSLSPDGAFLLYRHITPARESNLRLLSLDDTRTSEALLETSNDELNGEISPDGRWFAYQSNETGSFEIFIRPFPNVDAGKWQVTSGGGIQPAWGRKGNELFYLDALRLMSVPIELSSRPAIGAPQVILNDVGYTPYDRSGRSYDVSADGERLLVTDTPVAVSNEPFAGLGRIEIVLNWAEELKRSAR